MGIVGRDYEAAGQGVTTAAGAVRDSVPGISVLLTGRSDAGLSSEVRSRTMPTIGRIGPFNVMIFRNDHDPPHFHVFGPEFSAKFAIGDAALLSVNGRLRRRDVRTIEQWGQGHRKELHEIGIWRAPVGRRSGLRTDTCCLA